MKWLVAALLIVIALLLATVPNAQTCVVIDGLAYVGNETREQITLKNVCPFDVDITGWTVEDTANHTYRFGDGFLMKESFMTLHSGKGSDTESERYWNRAAAVWNDDGDVVFLRDSAGNVVQMLSYSA